MHRYIFLLATLLVLTATTCAHASGFVFGQNWMKTDTTLAGHNLAHLFDSTLLFNTYHVGGGVDWSTDRATSPISWSRNSTGDLIPAHGRHGWDPLGAFPVGLYSSGQRMIYQAIPRSLAVLSDTLTQLTTFYFRNQIVGDSFSITGHSPWTHWEILDSIDTTTNGVVLDSVELFDGPAENNRMWNAPARYYNVAVKMQVHSTNHLSTDTVLEAWVILHSYAWHGS